MHESNLPEIVILVFQNNDTELEMSLWRDVYQGLSKWTSQHTFLLWPKLSRQQYSAV